MATTSERRLVFLDAAVLAAPVTRSLILISQGHVAARYLARWSLKVEAEAESALESRAKGKTRNTTTLSTLRERFDWGKDVLVRDAPAVAVATEDTDPKDRHVIAAAAGSRIRIIVTPNVSDFGHSDLRRFGISVVHPDLFLAQEMTPAMYRATLEEWSASRSSPPNTPPAMHEALGRTFPRLTAAMTSEYPSVTPKVPHDLPVEVFRGVCCLVCGRILTDPTSLSLGVGQECRKR